MNPKRPMQNSPEEADVWTALEEQLRAELQQYRQELKEVGLMLDQSRLEVSRLSQRNASATAHLQQAQAQLENLPRTDLRGTYEASLEAQQRLFLMRGHLEKLQSDQTHLERHIASLEQVLRTLEENKPSAARTRSAMASVETLEMMIQAQETERQRLSRQMHDGPAQALSNFILQTEIAMRLFDMDKAKAREEMANLKTTATSAFQKVRDFIFELRPMMLDDLGLIPTIKRYVAAFKEQTGMEISLVTTGAERRLESYLEVMIFRALQELLSNAVYHGQAGQVKVQVDLTDTNVRVIVEDNGRGLDLETLEKEGGLGLNLIKERVEMLGGYFQVDSVAAQGARVTFQVPAVNPAGIE
jgi:two-component system sensor histidine kinase DegS